MVSRPLRGRLDLPIALLASREAIVVVLLPIEELEA